MRVQLPDIRVPLADEQGRMSRPWYDFFRLLYEQLDGYDGPDFTQPGATTLRLTVIATDGVEKHVDLTVAA